MEELMEKSSSTSKVCVTGGASYLGSWLVRMLLLKGYTVHATARNLADDAKLGLLKGLPGADSRLKLFQAEIYNPDDFEKAIQDCQFVFHMATPYQHNQESSQFKDTAEAAVAGVKSIAESCIRSGTVKKLIYTASVMGASPLKEDGSGFKTVMDETCWTPLNAQLLLNNSGLPVEYTSSKTLAEQEVLKYDGCGIQVVSLACALVAGDTIQSYTSLSFRMLLAQIAYPSYYQLLRFLEELTGKLPIVHVEDVSRAHIYCMEESSIRGRFLLVSDYLKTVEMAKYFKENYPSYDIPDQYIEDSGREIKWGSTKMEDAGFAYKHNWKTILDGSVNCAMRLGDLPQIQ